MASKKPKAKKIERLDYHECEEYIEKLLGYKLRDTLGKFEGPGVKDVEYRDFWHFICDINDVHNPCEIWIFEAREEWQEPIVQAFWNEFGEGPYWVEW